MSGIPCCPVCQAIDDCEHCLVEWHGWPGQRFRGVLLGLIDRLEERVTLLLVECSLVHVRPALPALQSAYLTAVDIVAGLRAAAEEDVEDEEASAQAYWTASVDREQLASELRRPALEFAIHCVRELPGVTEAAVEDLVSVAEREREWVSLWAADPGEVQRRLDALLGPIEAQLAELGGVSPGD